MRKTTLGPLSAATGEALAALGTGRVMERLWARDHTLWRDDPREISDRLGWLDLVAPGKDDDPELAELAAAVAREEVRDVVLLGMGGSSLGAEALRASFGETPGRPRLHVLDSTHPRWVGRVRRSIDPERALFVVASKSGTTAEVHAFYRYFRGEVEAAVGREAAGRHFVAVTDPGTPLVAMAERDGFRQVFVNPPDIGGRFSVLSRFGLVPAALMGIDTGALLRGGAEMARRSAAGVAAAENPGAFLGAVLAAAAESGRFLLTLLTPPRIATLGLWVEQLLAESTGKEGKGILPVTLEPEVDPTAYGDDRLFVVLHLRGEPDAGLEARAADLAAAGQPVVELELPGLDGLGGEFLRWELATAVASHLLGLHPFDQPDVESTKAETRRLLQSFEETGELPRVEADTDLAAALAAKPRFVALLAYADEEEGFESEVAELRSRLVTQHGAATTFGYGPRYLHSTGQFHKGGEAGGLYVQLLAESGAELGISAADRFGFGTLCRAQADGDLLALQGAGRRCVRLDLGDDAAAGVRKLPV